MTTIDVQAPLEAFLNMFGTALFKCQMSRVYK